MIATTALIPQTTKASKTKPTANATDAKHSCPSCGKAEPGSLPESCDACNHAYPNPMQFQRLVAKVATGLQHRGLPITDLIGEGQVGLMKACWNYNPVKEVKFMTYATQVIHNTIRRALREQRWPLPVSESAYFASMSAKKGDTPMQKNGNPVGQETLEAASKALHLTCTTGFANDYNPVVDDALDAFGSDLESMVEQLDLADALLDIPERLRKVVDMRFGLSGNEPMTFTQIGEIMSVHRERARQLVAEAIAKLQGKMSVQ